MAARNNPTPRKWTVQTAYTCFVGARIPLELVDRLKAYVESTALSRTDVICDALDKYLKERGA